MDPSVMERLTSGWVDDALHDDYLLEEDTITTYLRELFGHEGVLFGVRVWLMQRRWRSVVDIF
jgi:hypothetical protein